MKFRPTPLPGVTVIEIEPYRDERGFFARTYCAETFAAAGLPFGAVRQTSISHNPRRRSLRGIHWQAEANPEAKLVRVVSGRIFDVVVDLRAGSDSHARWFGIELDARRGNALLIPAGCGHGFITLDDDCLVDYAMDADYRPELARGARWDDRAFAIAWPCAPEVVSDRDRSWPDYRWPGA
jgi:dTDP-4-dehydrorhamnose 3,5-epimerase